MERGDAGAWRDQAAGAEGIEADFAGFLREDADAEAVKQCFDLFWEGIGRRSSRGWVYGWDGFLFALHIFLHDLDDTQHRSNGLATPV